MLHKLVLFSFYMVMLYMKYNCIHMFLFVYYFTVFFIFKIFVLYFKCVGHLILKLNIYKKIYSENCRFFLLLPSHSTIPTLCRQTGWISLKFIYSSCVSLHKIKQIHIFSGFLFIYSEKLAHMCVCVYI